jgi:hypothetical protein
MPFLVRLRDPLSSPLPPSLSISLSLSLSLSASPRLNQPRFTSNFLRAIIA